jgi:copper homeostasis protein
VEWQAGGDETLRRLLEICVDGVAAAGIACEAGADRIELCAGLSEGGTTPSLGNLRRTRRICRVELVVLIRPRGGDFLYRRDEIETMLADIHAAREEGADAVAIGLLETSARLDLEVMSELIEAARPMKVVCHRAFDHCRDLDAAYEDLRRLGIDRVLSSGGAPGAFAGIDALRRLVARSAEGPTVVPAGGLSPENLDHVAEVTGAVEFHMSAGRPQSSEMTWRNTECRLAAREGEFRLPDPALIRACLDILGPRGSPDSGPRA